MLEIDQAVDQLPLGGVESRHHCRSGGGVGGGCRLGSELVDLLLDGDQPVVLVLGEGGEPVFQSGTERLLVFLVGSSLFIERLGGCRFLCVDLSRDRRKVASQLLFYSGQQCRSSFVESVVHRGPFYLRWVSIGRT